MQISLVIRLSACLTLSKKLRVSGPSISISKLAQTFYVFQTGQGWILCSPNLFSFPCMLLKVSQSVCFTSNNESNDASKPDVKCADGSNLGQVYYYFSKKSDLIESNSGMEDLDVS